MSTSTFALALISILMSASAQISLKSGMSDAAIQQALSTGESKFGIAWLMASSGYVIFGLLLYGAGAIIWLLVLAKVDVTLAYPFVGLGFILTMLFGIFLLGEHVSLSRALGTLLIVSGVVLMAKS